MFSRLLIASDISSSAYAVIDCLHHLKKYGAEKCLLVTCLNFTQYSPVPDVQLESLFEKNLQDQREILEKQGFQVETRCVPGIPDEIINRIAEEEDYSTIVVGSFPRSWAGDAIMGGLAYDVIHSAKKPVLLIRLEENPEAGATAAKASTCDFGSHVLFPTDFSKNADYAFKYLKKLVKDGIQKVTLMHIQDQYKIEPFLLDKLNEFNRIDDSRLAQMKEMLRSNSDVIVETRLLYGSPAVEILRYIKENQVSLVVMGSQGRGFVQELFLGSVSHNVARRSPASVLLIPAIR